MSKAGEEIAHQRWRDLGFYYDYDEKTACWLILADKNGVKRFIQLLKDYSNNPKLDVISEHIHLGPYQYLEIMTSNEPKITSHAISGTLKNILELANTIERKLIQPNPGDTFTIDKEFSNSNEATIKFQIKEDGFDPARADPQLS